MNLYNYISELHILWLFSRVLSALLGTSIVLFAYLIAREVFDKKSGLFSAFLLSVTMGFVTISHFATSDIPSIFWFSLSCLMSTYVYKRNARRWYILAGLFIGFAAATKYVGGLALITLVVAHVLSRQYRHRNLLLGILVAILSFLLANPVAFFSSCEFLEAFFKDNLFNSFRNAGGPRAFLPLISNLLDALGVPLFLLSACGLIYSLILMYRKDTRAKVSLVLSMIIPYYLVMGSMHSSKMRYIMPIVPFLLILTGKLVSDCLVVKNTGAKIFSTIIFLTVICYSLLFSIAADLEFTYDSRKLAKHWISSNIRDDSTIEVTSYFTALPKDKYNVIRRPHNNKVDKTASLVNDSKAYLFFMSLVSKYQSSAEKYGLCSGERPYYTAWYERAMNRYIRHSSNFDLSIRGLDSRGVDYLVVSRNYFKRFDRDNDSPEGKFFASLFTGESEYEKIAEFKYRFHPWIDPSPEFVNPLILVYKKGNIDQ